MRSARRRRARLGAVSFASVLAVAVPTLAVAASTSGSAPAIQLYRSASSVMNHLPGYVIAQHGYVRIDDSIGRHRLTLWAWGQDQFQPGEVSTNERLVLSQRHGRVLWILDTLRPVKTCAQGGPCPSILPLQFFITQSAAYAGIVSSGSTAACFQREQLSDMPYLAGASWWFAFGHFSPPKPSGAETMVVSTYSQAGQRWTERDWIRTTTHDFVRSTFSIARAAHHRAFGFAARYSVLAARPATPKLTLCPKT